MAGDVFVDQDSRLGGRTLKVLALARKKGGRFGDGQDVAQCEMSAGFKVYVRIDRLKTPHLYRRR